MVIPRSPVGRAAAFHGSGASCDREAETGQTRDAYLTVEAGQFHSPGTPDSLANDVEKDYIGTNASST